ncbi:integrase, catalytic region, zinc finger, CCHC-type containing protein [Tanacetum coccineum]
MLQFVSDMYANSKSKSVKETKKKEEWKPTGKVFTKIGYQWRPTRRTFNLVRNAYPLTRIATTNKVPLREPIPLEVIAQESVVTKVYTRRPKVHKNNGSNSKPKIAKSVIFNKKQTRYISGIHYFSCSIFFFCRYHVVQIVLWYLDSGCSKHMTEDRSQLTNFVHKFLGTVKFGNDQIAKIIGYGDYQIGNITILRVYYVEGLGHNLFSVGQFCDSDLEVAFRKHTCFVRNLEGVDLLSGSQDTNLYTLSIGDMMTSSPICLLFKASKTKSWLWHRRLSQLNFGAINHLAKNGLVVQILLWYLNSECSKHMTGDRSQLTNFFHKFLGTVKFGNDQIAKIIGYGDYQIGNITISKVYYVEQLGHNLFSVGQFCDLDFEVAFRKYTCFVRNLEGVDLLSGSRETNLYTLSIEDMMPSSPICLLFKASKNKSC